MTEKGVRLFAEKEKAKSLKDKHMWYCLHKPQCPVGVQTWVCQQRTRIEDAVSRGLIQREPARKLLEKYGLPMTSPSRVHKGDPPPVAHQERLLL